MTDTKWYIVLASLALVLGSLLVWAVSAYAGASAQARLLDAKLDTALAAVAVAEDERTVAVAATDGVLAMTDSIMIASAAAVAEAQANTSQAVADSEAAFRSAVALAEDNPVLERAIEEMRAEQIVETMAWEAERSEHTAAAFALTQQIRSMESAFTRERAAWLVETDGLRDALSLAQQESDAWQRAAAPGALTQVWRQGRFAALAVVVVLALK